MLTGSTNWTSSGLCTQANNGLIIDDADVAQDFLDAWNRIKAAGNDYPKAFIDGNSTARTLQVDGCKVTPWFVSTSAAQDLEYARSLINKAKDGILFLFFNPGPFRLEPMQWTLLQNVLERHNESNATYNPDLYIRGVVNQEIPQLTKPGVPKDGTPQPAAALDPTTAVESPVSLFKGGSEAPLRLSHDAMVPHNIKSQFHDWEQELLGASMVNIHSKVIVLDPFGDNPVVMTGSHNLGYKASHENDDNLVIVEGNAPLAAAYAINIIAIYQTYRWNSYVEAHRTDPKVWHGLVDNDEWQTSHLAGDELAELKFWLDQKSGGSAAPMRATARPPNRRLPRSALGDDPQDSSSEKDLEEGRDEDREDREEGGREEDGREEGGRRRRRSRRRRSGRRRSRRRRRNSHSSTPPRDDAQREAVSGSRPETASITRQTDDRGSAASSICLQSCCRPVA